MQVIHSQPKSKIKAMQFISKRNAERITASYRHTESLTLFLLKDEASQYTHSHK